MINSDQKCSKVVEESRARQLRLKGLVLDSELTLELTTQNVSIRKDLSK